MAEKPTREDLIEKHGTLLQFTERAIRAIDSGDSESPTKDEAIQAIQNYSDALDEAAVNEKVIQVMSGVSHRTREGFVNYSWGTQRTQFTADQARAHAYVILECAEASIMDAAVLQFFTKTIKMDEKKALLVIRELREHRADMKAQGTIQ